MVEEDVHGVGERGGQARVGTLQPHVYHAVKGIVERDYCRLVAPVFEEDVAKSLFVGGSGKQRGASELLVDFIGWDEPLEANWKLRFRKSRVPNVCFIL